MAEIFKLESPTDDAFRLKDISTETIQGVCVGKLISVDKTGHILLDYQDNSFGPACQVYCEDLKHGWK